MGLILVSQGGSTDATSARLAPALFPIFLPSGEGGGDGVGGALDMGFHHRRGTIDIAVDGRFEQGAVFYRNSEIEETGLTAGVLVHPAMATAWLASKLAPFDVTLEPGHMMLSGFFTRPVWADKGDALHAGFGPLGGVAVQFV